MFARTRALFRKIPRSLRALTFSSALTLLLGVAANMLVMQTNGGMMPVAMKKEHVLFTLGNPRFGVNVFMDEHDFADDPRHQPMREDMHFLIFADRVPISMRSITPYNTPMWLWRMLYRIELPVGSEAIASIGDLSIWTGLILGHFLILIFPLWLAYRITRRLFGRQ